MAAIFLDLSVSPIAWYLLHLHSLLVGVVAEAMVLVVVIGQWASTK